MITYKSLWTVPTKEVIEDDDMLDGWFIVQAEKREQEKAENEFDNNTNEKVKNSDEVFVMTKNEKDIHRVENMNSLDSKMVKKQRAAVMKKKDLLNSKILEMKY